MLILVNIKKKCKKQRKKKSTGDGPLSRATSANAYNMSTFSIVSKECFSTIALATSSIFHEKSRSDSSSSASARSSTSLSSSSSS